jgi:hypothetical protein
VLCSFQHVDDHGNNEHCCDQREYSFPQRNDGHLSQPSPQDYRGSDRGGRSPANRGKQRFSAGFPEISRGDGDDQEHLDSFAQRDQKHVQHRVFSRYVTQ